MIGARVAASTTEIIKVTTRLRSCQSKIDNKTAAAKSHRPDQEIEIREFVIGMTQGW